MAAARRGEWETVIGELVRMGDEWTTIDRKTSKRNECCKRSIGFNHHRDDPY